MKLSELRPCDNCGAKIAPVFYIVRMSVALFKRDATNQIMGMAQYFNGRLALAELFAPDPEVAVVGMDENKELMTELFLCNDCHMKPINLALLAEQRAERIQAATAHSSQVDTDTD